MSESPHEIEAFKNDLPILESNIPELKKLHMDIISAFDPKHIEVLRNKMELKLFQILQELKSIKAKIKDLNIPKYRILFGTHLKGFRSLLEAFWAQQRVVLVVIKNKRRATLNMDLEAAERQKIIDDLVGNLKELDHLILELSDATDQPDTTVFSDGKKNASVKATVNTWWNWFTARCCVEALVVAVRSFGHRVLNRRADTD